MEEFEKQKQLALSLLNKTQNVGKLPSKYLIQSSTVKKTMHNLENSNSTVNESDLLNSVEHVDCSDSSIGLKGREPSLSSQLSENSISKYFENGRPSESKLTFTPYESSTPRASNCSGEYSKKLEEITNKIVNTDISITEVLKDFREFDSRLSDYSRLSEINRSAFNIQDLSKMSENSSFLPAEHMVEKLKADELSWMKKHGSLGLSDIRLSDTDSLIRSNVSSSCGKISEFFFKKSEKISDLNLNKSPEKQNIPYPLIDLSSLQDITHFDKAKNKTGGVLKENEDDTVTLTQIEKLIAANDDTQHLISMMFKKGYSKKNDVGFQKEDQENMPHISSASLSSQNKQNSYSRFSYHSSPNKNEKYTKRTSLRASPSEKNIRRKSPAKHFDKDKISGEKSEGRRSSEHVGRGQDMNQEKMNRSCVLVPKFLSQENLTSSAHEKKVEEKKNIHNDNYTAKDTPTTDVNGAFSSGRTVEKPQEYNQYFKVSAVGKKGNLTTSPIKIKSKEKENIQNDEIPTKDGNEALPSCKIVEKSQDHNQYYEVGGIGKKEDFQRNVNYLEIPTKYGTQRISLSSKGTSSSSSQLLSPVSDITQERNKRSFSPNSCYSQTCDDKSSHGSVRSGSSLESLPDGKLPVESTRTELIWGCLKVGKKSTQEFILRNRSNQKVRLEATLTGSSFRILKDRHDSELLTSVQILLHPKESRAINVSFLPTSVGAASEKLNFQPVDKTLQSQYVSKQMIWLFGYGGHATVDFLNVSKDTRGKYWLPLGNLAEKISYVKTLELKNVGTVMSFAVLTVEYRGLKNYSNINVSPSHVVLKPNEVVEVSVTFCPNKDDFKQILESMNREGVEVAFLTVVSGPEPLRGRIRRLRQKINEQMGVIPDFPIVHSLCVAFPGEKMPHDIFKCKESPSAMKDLLKCLTHREIAITLEQDADQTIVANHPGLDDSSYFLSLCHNERTEINLETSVQKFRNFFIEPDRLFLSPPQKFEDSFLITCEGSNEVYFEVVVEDQELLQCVPQNGSVLPGDPVFVMVRCDAEKMDRAVKLSKIKVYVENEMAELNVKIVLMKNLRAGSGLIRAKK